MTPYTVKSSTLVRLSSVLMVFTVPVLFGAGVVARESLAAACFIALLGTLLLLAAVSLIVSLYEETDDRLQCTMRDIEERVDEMESILETLVGEDGDGVDHDAPTLPSIPVAVEFDKRKAN